MTYEEFEWNLCNRVFTMAVFFPNEYSGVHTLVIQDWDHTVIAVVSNKDQTSIRVSYPTAQYVFGCYDEAYKFMRDKKRGISQNDIPM